MKSTNYYPKVGTQITDLVWIESSLYQRVLQIELSLY